MSRRTGERRGSGQGDHRWMPQPLDHLAQAQVVRAEVVTPGRHAVRLVHHEQPDPGLHSRSTTSSLASCSGDRNTYSALPCRPPPTRAVVRRCAAAELTATASGAFGVVDALQLVPLQGQQRGDHQRRTGDQQGRHLVDGRLAGTGGQHDQHIPARMVCSMAASWSGRSSDQPNASRATCCSFSRAQTSDTPYPRERALKQRRGTACSGARCNARPDSC